MRGRGNRGPESSAVPPLANSATVVGADADRRRLLRGLLGLSHRPVASEAPSLAALPGDDAPALLVLDTAGADGRWAELLQRSLADRPERSALVLLPADDPDLRAAAARAGARAVLAFPFSTRDFADAVRTATSPPLPSTRRD